MSTENNIREKHLVGGDAKGPQEREDVSLAVSLQPSLEKGHGSHDDRGATISEPGFK